MSTPNLRTTATLASPCPYCGLLIAAATAAPGNASAEPTPGMVSLCARCCELLVFDEDLRVRKPTASELLNIQLSTGWREIEQYRRAMDVPENPYRKEWGKP